MIDTFTHTASPEVIAPFLRFNSDSITQHCPFNHAPFNHTR